MMDSFQMPLSNSASASNAVACDPELEGKVKKASEKISENLHIFANEPSLACYRLQEHIHKSLPQLVQKRIEVNQMHKELQGKCYDLEYAISAVKAMQKSSATFHNIGSLILDSINAKQRLNAKEDANKKASDKKTKSSMYQRFSGSFDIPSSIVPSGLSSSTSVSADLKSSPVNVGKASPRRSRAASVSSSVGVSPAEKAALTRQQSVSCSPTKK